jgi:hypothetical protein
MLLVNPSADIGIFKADQRDGLDREICVASVQTATRHTDWLKERGFSLCTCDEAQTAKLWGKSFWKSSLSGQSWIRSGYLTVILYVILKVDKKL